MADQPIPISDIDDPDLIRVQLLASGRPVHAPLSSLNQFYDVATVTHAAASKATPVDADEIPLVDSAAGFTLKKLTWANLKEGIRAFLYGANKVTPVNGDVFGMLDSATSFSPKYSTWAQIKTVLQATFDTLYVALTGNQTVAGIKTFSSIPVLSGGAIAFPATQVPSAGANDLDDYEEGTFTPAIEGTTTAGVGTYSQQVGIYTKIGRVVFVEISLAWSAHTGTGNIVITGLPFTAAASPASRALQVLFSSLTYAGDPTALISGSTTSISPRTMATGAATAQIAMDTAATIVVSGFYTV